MPLYISCLSHQRSAKEPVGTPVGLTGSRLMKGSLAKEWAGSRGQNQTEGTGHIVISSSLPEQQGWDVVFPTPTDRSLKGTELGKTRCPWGGGSRKDTSIPVGVFSSPVFLSSRKPTKSYPCRSTLMIFRVTSPTRTPDDSNEYKMNTWPRLHFFNKGLGWCRSSLEGGLKKHANL